MKKQIHFIYLIALTIFMVAGCSENNGIPNSAEDKITNLVVQAEIQSNTIQTSIELISATVAVENLALSPDYFVDANLLSSSPQFDSSHHSEPWKNKCNSDYIFTEGFTHCLLNLNLSNEQAAELKNILNQYKLSQLPLIGAEFKRQELLKDSFHEQIEAVLDSLNEGKISEFQFQSSIATHKQSFIKTLRIQRLASKTMSRFSTNYRNALEAFKESLSENQFKQFYLCHKK